ncbi:MAG: xylulokinase [Nitrososphaerota archaeon]|nr:xylulokinase [Candidatus Bathyarchaeota archaeon]MDW8048254.1 xylulokinase [Nitrososphaerota archaeon]
MTEEGLYIGVDVGTQSTKTIVFDGESGRVLAKASQGYGLIEGLPPGHKEQDPSVWIEALRLTIKMCLKEASIDPARVRAIGVSGQQHGLVPLDEKGNVIRPAKLWNDTSTVNECKYLIRKLGGKRSVIELLGLSIPPGFTASKILWLKRHEPMNFRKLRTILLPHDYVNFYLTGRKVMEYGDASGTALMNVRTRTWCMKVLETIDPGLEEKLPPVQSSDKPVGFIRREIAEKFGFKDDVLVSAGGGDNMMGAIGTGNTRKGIVTASLGTSGTIYAYSDVPIVDPEGEIACFCDSTNAWLPLLCTMNVTVATEFARNLFGLSHDDLLGVTEMAPPGSDGLILLPYFEGERTPNVPDGTGVFFGLNSKTYDKAHIMRASMEGATLGMNYGLNKMRELGIRPEEIRLTGGGSKNKAWRQIAADIFEVDVVCLEIDEGAAFGAALQALWTYKNFIGHKVTIQEVTERYVKVDENSRLSPKTKNVKVYRNLQKIHDELSRSLRRVFRKHRSFLEQYVGGARGG